MFGLVRSGLASFAAADHLALPLSGVGGLPLLGVGGGIEREKMRVVYRRKSKSRRMWGP